MRKVYSLDIKSTTDSIFRKLEKKNLKQLMIINKKIKKIRQNPWHKYKFLKKPLQGLNRVHIDKNFVLIFKIIHSKQTVEIWFYGHHDEVYKKKFV